MNNAIVQSDSIRRSLRPVTCVILLLSIAACRSAASTLTENLPEGDGRYSTYTSSSMSDAASADTADRFAQTYSFNADPASAMTLTLEAAAPDVQFTAQVLDQSDRVVALLDGGTLRNATLTVAPGNGLYKIRVSSNQSGRADSAAPVNLFVSRAAVDAPLSAMSAPEDAAPANIGGDFVSVASAAPVETSAIAAPVAASVPCTITSPAVTVNVRNGPSTSYPIVGRLAVGSALTASGQSANGWFLVSDTPDGQSWISSSVVNTQGECAALPVVAPSFPSGEYWAENVAYTTYNSAPAVNSYTLALDRDNGGQFDGAISYPMNNGRASRADMLTLQVNGLSPNAPNHQRTFAVALVCSGVGVENVRWGAPEDPVFTCGNALIVPFSFAQSQQSFVIVLPQNAATSAVNYRLSAVPAAPADRNPYEVTFARDDGGVFSEVVSAPDGDYSDYLQIGVADLNAAAPDQFRLYHLTLLCGGTGVDQLRWGLPDSPTLACGSTLTIPFTLGHDQVSLAITLLNTETTRSYVNYTLQAAPAAPQDSSAFFFDVDRDGEAQFSDAISMPDGDRADLIEMRVTNLSPQSPDNYREFNVTLFCDGMGIDALRWGIPANPTLGCGSTIRAPFLYSSAANGGGYSFAVTLPQENVYSTDFTSQLVSRYVRYTLLATVAA